MDGINVRMNVAAGAMAAHEGQVLQLSSLLPYEMCAATQNGVSVEVIMMLTPPF